MELIIILCLFGIAAAIVANNKGRNGCAWFLLGFLLGPFGLIFALVSSKNEKDDEEGGTEPAAGNDPDTADLRQCPYCAELIKKAAIKCRFCGESVAPATEAVPPAAPPPPEPRARCKGENRYTCTRCKKDALLDIPEIRDGWFTCPTCGVKNLIER